MISIEENKKLAVKWAPVKSFTFLANEILFHLAWSFVMDVILSLIVVPPEPRLVLCLAATKDIKILKAIKNDWLENVKVRIFCLQTPVRMWTSSMEIYQKTSSFMKEQNQRINKLNDPFLLNSLRTFGMLKSSFSVHSFYSYWRCSQSSAHRRPAKLSSSQIPIETLSCSKTRTSHSHKTQQMTRSRQISKEMSWSPKHSSQKMFKERSPSSLRKYWKDSSDLSFV